VLPEVMQTGPKKKKKKKNIKNSHLEDVSYRYDQNFSNCWKFGRKEGVSHFNRKLVWMQTL
jgi:hypothetical protein